MTEQNYQPTQSNKSTLSTAGLVLGIIAVCFSFIPLMFYVSLILGALALIFGAISLAKKAPKGKAVSALVLGIIAVALSISTIATINEAIDEIDDAINDLNDDLSYIGGDKTEDILKNYLSVTTGKFEVTESTYITNTKLSVNVKNISSEKRSFSIQIEAVNKNGTRIDTDYIYVNDLGAGQDQKFDIFTYVSTDKLSEMKTATFRVVEVSMY